MESMMIKAKDAPPLKKWQMSWRYPIDKKLIRLQP